MNKKDKIKLIRDIEQTIGFRRFNVTEKSSYEEIDDVFSFINTAYNELDNNFIPQINSISDNN